MTPETELIEESVATEPEAELETTEATEPVEGEDTAPEPIAATEEVPGDNRVVPKYIKDLQATDPAGYKRAKEQFFQHRDFMAAFPEGPSAAKDVLKVMADIGGSEGLATIQQRAQQLDQMVDLAQKNPSAVLDELVQAAPGREAEVAARSIEHWRQNDSDGYERAMNGMVAQTMSNIRFDSQMDRALLLLEVGRTEDAAKVLNGIKEQVTAFGEAAAAPAKPKQQAGPDPNDQRAQELDTREAKMFDDALGQSIIAYRDPLILKEAEQWTKGMTLTDRQKGALVRDVTAGIGELLQKDAKWMTEYKTLSAKRDQAGTLRLYQDKAAKIAPDIVKNVSRELFGSPVSAARKVTPPAAKPAPKPSVTPMPGRKVDKFDEIYNSL